MAAGEVKQRITKGKTQKEITEEKKKKYFDPLIDGVKWIEKYSESLDKLFARLPAFIGTFIATIAVILFGSTLRGEWVVILVTALKQFTGQTQTGNVTTEEIFKLFTSNSLKMDNFGYILVAAHTVSYTMYFMVGGFLHWYFYMNRRHIAHEWKIQPDKWLTPELELHEIMVGVVALLVTGSFSAFIACYILNGNPSMVYYQFEEYGWLWFILQFPLIFLYMDYTTYLMHRLYHTPWLYKHFHKLHHKYKTPTAFSVTAMHPVELLHIQVSLCLPLFIVPLHWAPFYVVVIYNYYHGIIDHSGVNFQAQWWQPWQNPAKFHDQHHEFFHCNFGFNVAWWDWVHGTVRKKNFVYNEETFNGEAPALGTKEAAALLEKEPELAEIIKKPGVFDKTELNEST